MSFDLDIGAAEIGSEAEELYVAPFIAEATLVVPGIGAMATLELPSFAAEATFVPPGFVAIDLRRSDIVYGASMDPALRAWEFDDDPDAEIGANEIGYVPSVSRVYVTDPLYVATTAFGTSDADSPASTPFKGKLAGLSFKRSIASGDRFGGVASGDGELILDNADGAYDNLIRQAIAGATISIRAGLLTQPWQYWLPIFTGTARSWTFDDDEVHIQIRDNSYRLKAPIQTTLYAGTGGKEGGTAIEGKRKPLALGYVPNVSPPQLDPATLTYQIHDGELDAIFNIRDKGAAITIDSDYATYALLVAATIPAGNAATCLAEGIFRLESEPQGTVTADAATYRSTGAAPLATILRGVLGDRTTLTSFYEASFTALGVLYPGDHGIWVGPNDEWSVADVVEKLVAGVMGYVGFRRDGTCFVGVIDTPGVPLVTYGTGKAMALSNELLPASFSPPPWRLRLNYDINHTVQTDLAGSADQVWAQPAKVAVALDSNVKLDYGADVAQDLAPIDSFMVGSTAAEAEATRQHAIVKTERPYRRVTLPRLAFTIELGAAIGIEWDRLGGYRVGLNVSDDIEIRPNAREVETVDLSLYG